MAEIQNWLPIATWNSIPNSSYAFILCYLNKRRDKLIFLNFDLSLPIFEGCLTVHLPREVMWNANLIQQDNFIDVSLAQHVSGAYAH